MLTFLTMVDDLVASLQWLSLLTLALLEVLAIYVCSALGLSLPISLADDFAPHETAGFEGYYSRTLLEGGGTLTIIFCRVKRARRRPNLVCICYSPAEADATPGFTHILHPEHMDTVVDRKAPGAPTPFRITAGGVGSMDVGRTNLEYTIDAPDVCLSLNLRLLNCLPWSHSHPLLGPMGPMAPLSPYLPLNWHVKTVSSDATLAFTHSGRTFEFRGQTHFEKNWGQSFPNGWIWCQAFGQGKCLSFAGGDALSGVQAFLVGYRSADFQWDFRPPYAAAFGVVSPFMAVRHNSRAGFVELEVSTLFRRLVISVRAPPDSFVGLPAPMREGHEPCVAFESFKATVWTELLVRVRPWSAWTRVETGYLGVAADGCPCGALEFGGSFYHQTGRAKTG